MVFLFLFILELLLLFLISQLLTKSLSLLFYKITKSQTLTVNMISFLFLPGVIIHELSHMFCAGLLMVPVGEIEFIPKFTEGGVRLGSVAIGKTDPIRRAIIGFAPVVTGTALIIGLIYYLYSLSSFSLFWKLLIIFYLVFEVGNTMFSSRKDLEGTLELLLVFLILAMAFYLIGVRIPKNFTIFIFSPRNIEYLQKACTFLFVPITADLIVIGLTKILNRE